MVFYVGMSRGLSIKDKSHFRSLLYQYFLYYQVPFLPLFLLAIVWCLSVIFSRLYLGVHSVLVSYFHASNVHNL